MPDWFSLPDEIRQLIISFVLSDLKLRWRGQGRWRDQDPSFASSDFSQLKSLVLVSKQFVHPRDVLVLGMRQKILDVFDSQRKWVYGIPDNIQTAFDYCPLLINNDLTKLQILISDDWAHTGGRILLSYDSFGSSKLVLPPPDLSFMLSCLPTLRHIKIIGLKEVISIPQDHPILTIRGTIGTDSYSKRHLQRSPEYKIGGRHGLFMGCHEHGIMYGRTEQPTPFTEKSFTFKNENYKRLEPADKVLQATIRRDAQSAPPVQRLPANCLWRGCKISDNRGLCSPSVLDFLRAVTAKGVHVDIVQPLSLTAGFGTGNCQCLVSIDAVFSLAVQSLVSTYGGCQWIIPQTLPTQFLERLKEALCGD